MTLRAVVSIHDVHPGTIGDVEQIAELLDLNDVHPVTVLVVPGSDWDSASLGRLHDLIDSRGYGVAGHGWSHRADKRSTIGHHLHAALLSRDQAEHLSRPRQEIEALVVRCYRWFAGAGLKEPTLYVPPAWALGQLRRSDLETLPFRWYEVLSGYVSAETGTLRPVPLVGFEADTGVRRLALRFLNGLNRRLARGSRPLRISIHPRDLRLRLSSDLRWTLTQRWKFTTVEAFMGAVSEERTGSARSREV